MPDVFEPILSLFARFFDKISSFDIKGAVFKKLLSNYMLLCLS